MASCPAAPAPAPPSPPPRPPPPAPPYVPFSFTNDRSSSSSEQTGPSRYGTTRLATAGASVLSCISIERTRPCRACSTTAAVSLPVPRAMSGALHDGEALDAHDRPQPVELLQQGPDRPGEGQVVATGVAEGRDDLQEYVVGERSQSQSCCGRLRARPHARNRRGGSQAESTRIRNQLVCIPSVPPNWQNAIVRCAAVPLAWDISMW